MPASHAVHLTCCRPSSESTTCHHTAALRTDQCNLSDATSSSGLQAALCAALGGAASYVYVAWLCADVDRLTPNDDIPMARATNIRDPLARGAAKLFAGIRQQAQPRLLVRSTGLALLLPLIAHLSATPAECTCSMEPHVLRKGLRRAG